ncbi:transmembrane protein 154 isoform X2 [Amblyraja radiata]|uniref:transmembrane protein 154 isoform X2 n=1 Tax=Amblyraja radiata TaxID=386614 RepID=UPI0014040D42|nr:transmembrane protein 154 isoform X2 [Amblyraja radiata]
MNQRNSKLYLIVTAVLLFSGKSYSLGKTGNATTMNQATQTAEYETDTASTPHGPCTHNCPTSQPSSKASPTASQSSAATTIILEDVRNEDIANPITKAIEHLWIRTENSTYALVFFSSSGNTTKIKFDNRKLIGIILLPILILFLLGLIIAIVMTCSSGKRKRKYDDIIPTSPIFEEDAASVMEVEMEEVTKWMGSMKQKSQHENLSDVIEDKN